MPCLRNHLPRDTRESLLAVIKRRSQSNRPYQVDGAEAKNMVREDWLELGASGLKAAKILGEIDKLRLAILASA